MTARRESLEKAVARLEEALAAPETAMNRDATIQRFEFTFELAWKAIQEVARAQGLSCQSPKECLRLAFQQEWITNEARWLAMLEDRNRTSHTYDETFAHALYSRLPDYLEPLQRLTAFLQREA